MDGRVANRGKLCCINIILISIIYSRDQSRVIPLFCWIEPFINISVQNTEFSFLFDSLPHFLRQPHTIRVRQALGPSDLSSYTGVFWRLTLTLLSGCHLSLPLRNPVFKQPLTDTSHDQTGNHRSLFCSVSNKQFLGYSPSFDCSPTTFITLFSLNVFRFCLKGSHHRPILFNQHHPSYNNTSVTILATGQQKVRRKLWTFKPCSTSLCSSTKEN